MGNMSALMTRLISDFRHTQMKCFHFEFQLISSIDRRIMCLNVAFGRKGLSMILPFWKLPRITFSSHKKTEESDPQTYCYYVISEGSKGQGHVMQTNFFRKDDFAVFFTLAISR